MNGWPSEETTRPSPRSSELARRLRRPNDSSVEESETRASGAAEPEIRRTIYQQRCAILEHDAPTALPMTERALELAQRHGVTDEVSRCQANLAVVLLELGNWNEAVAHGRGCNESLRGGERSAALNNLGLALAFQGDVSAAGELLEAAFATAERHHRSAVRSNLQVVRADGKPEWVFGLLAPATNRTCAPRFYEPLLFNHMRSLVDIGELARAGVVAEWGSFPAAGRRDAELLAGRWATLYREICRGLGKPVPARVEARAEGLDRSTKPQAWMYRARWAVCSIPLADPASPDEI